jgi:hypothetical protein
MFEKLNEAIAVYITERVGTMWCAYAFTCLALISLPAAIHSGIATLIAWIAQTFLQLVLLPLIMVGGNVLNRKTEERAKQDHQMLMEELALLRKIHLLLGGYDDQK